MMRTSTNKLKTVRIPDNIKSVNSFVVSIKKIVHSPVTESIFIINNENHFLNQILIFVN